MSWLFSNSTPHDGNDRELLRFLLTLPRVSPGARALLVGFRHFPLIHEMLSAGLCVTCLEPDDTADCPAELDNIDDVRADIDWLVGATPRESFGPGFADFDLVLTTASAVGLTGRTLQRSTLIATGGLLACLRPGGTLVVFPGSVCRDSEGLAEGAVRHLVGFPGELRRTRFTTGRPNATGSHREQWGVTLTVPEQRVSMSDWDHLALRAVAPDIGRSAA